MLGKAWLTIRQAQEALKCGRLEEAHRLLNHSAARGHKRSWELLDQVGMGFVARGEGHLRENDLGEAWTDLLQAEQAGIHDSRARGLRQELTARALGEVRNLLEAGEAARAMEAIVLLRERMVRSPELDQLEEATREWLLARELASKGEFGPALQVVERIRRILPQRLMALESLQSDLDQRHQTFPSLLGQLHQAVEQGRWREVVELSDQVLAVAPNHAEARKARTRAWKAIEPNSTATTRRPAEAARVVSSPTEPLRRFLLWVDGVGAYLVCLASRVTLGQAAPDAFVDIPLFADVSRLHATLTRDTEGYLLEAVRPLQVNGQTSEKALLRSGDRITLGSSCQVQFTQPVPVSATARLDLTSGHRLPLALDAVLLMADTLVLGPGSQAHVSLPDIRQPIVLHRQKDGLAFRYPGPVTVDGERCLEQRAALGSNATVSGEDFALTVEAVGARLGRS